MGNSLNSNCSNRFYFVYYDGISRRLRTSLIYTVAGVRNEARAPVLFYCRIIHRSLRMCPSGAAITVASFQRRIEAFGAHKFLIKTDHAFSSFTFFLETV